MKKILFGGKKKNKDHKYREWGTQGNYKVRFDMSGEYVISSVLSCNKNLKHRTSVKAYSSALFGKQRQPRGMRMGLPKRGMWLNFGSSFYMFVFFFPPLEPALCKLDQPGRLFVSPEILTLVLAPSFILFSWAFSFLCLLATTILDSFFQF